MLAIGIVVDDAIVVVEGAVHNIEKGMSGREAASAAMRQLLGPIVGITLVLMSVFLPAAFLPGLTGRMYAQFALVIAATALLSAINAATLKPTQSAMWLRPAVPPERRNVFYRAFNRAYARVEQWYASLIARMVSRSGLMAALALALIAATGYGFSRVPTGFLPIEDQGYLIALVQLPDGASLERTQKTLDRVFDIARHTPGVARVVNIAGVSALDNSATLSSAGVAYIILKDWSERGEGEDLMSLFTKLNTALGAIAEADILVMPPPPIQGVGNDAGFTMQVELRDGSFDMAKLQSVTNAIVANAKTQSALQLVLASFRSSVPQYRLEVDRVKTEALQVSVDQVFAALAGYLGSTYVNQFNQFGRVFQVYVQADSQSRLRLEDIENMFVRNKDGKMVPLGTLVTITPMVGAPRSSACSISIRPRRSSACRRRGSRPVRRSRSWKRLPGARFPRAPASNGARCPIRRSSSAIRCTSCSRWRCCSSTSCSPASTKAGTPRSRSFLRCRCRSSGRSWRSRRSSRAGSTTISTFRSGSSC